MFVRTLEVGGGGYNVCSFAWVENYCITVTNEHKVLKYEKANKLSIFRNSLSIKYFLKFPFKLKKEKKKQKWVELDGEKSATVFIKPQRSEWFKCMHWPKRWTCCVCGLTMPIPGSRRHTQSSPGDASNLSSAANWDPRIPGQHLLPQRTTSRLHPLTYDQHKPKQYNEPEFSLWGLVTQHRL